MSTPATDALRTELLAAIDLLDPQIKGLDDFLLLHLSEVTRSSVQREQSDHVRRRGLCRDVLTALEALNSDNYPSMPKAELGASSWQELQDQYASITAALAEFDTFFQRFPSSPLTPEVRQKWRIARDRLSEGAFTVGVFYYKKHWYPGAADRFNEVIREDPGYTHIDAVYYYLAETFASADRKGEAIPLFDRVVKEYRTSEYLSKAQKRLQELNAQ